MEIIYNFKRKDKLLAQAQLIYVYGCVVFHCVCFVCVSLV